MVRAFDCAEGCEFKTDLDHQLENSRLMQQQMTVDSNSHHPIAARLGTPLHKLNYNSAIVGMNYIFCGFYLCVNSSDHLQTECVKFVCDLPEFTYG